MAEPEETDNKVKVLTVEQLEFDCKICYSRFDAYSRRPKLLHCLHRVCAKCLNKLLQTGESSLVITCPFCRQETHLKHNELWLMEEDTQILSILTQNQTKRPAQTRAKTGSGEVLLSPTSLSDSDCLLITVLELPEDSSSSLSMLSAIYRPPDSTPCYLPKSHTWTSRSLPRCLLGAFCMVYFSSLPLGIYLLMIGRLWMGVVLVSLVPLTLLALVLYGFCQCLIQEALDTVHALQHGRRTTSP